jgi:glycosyltransferase domain-containing protein
MKLLIPTRNRPSALQHVLGYFARYYPTTQIIVADGSEDHHAVVNRATVARLRSAASIDYRPYAPDLPLFDRLLDVLRGLPDNYVAMGADDDFPLMDVLTKAKKFLELNADYSTAMGARVHLRLLADDSFEARIIVARSIAIDSRDRRARQYAQWPFATTYAVTRRQLLLERYERARELFLPGFYDFAVGIHDCMAGKIKAFPELGYLCTSNYGHSYLRPEAPLIFLRKSELVLKIMERIKYDLTTSGELDDAAARRIAEGLIENRIGELIGRPATKLKGFDDQPLFTNPLVLRQFQLFTELFSDGAEAHAQFRDKLLYISQATRANAKSNDNCGERTRYETPEDQLRAEASQTTPEPLKEFRTRTRRRQSGINDIIHLDPDTMLPVDVSEEVPRSA